jgi:hypothetical protein
MGRRRMAVYPGVSLFCDCLRQPKEILLFNNDMSLELSSDKLGIGIGAETLRALNRGTESTVDNKLGKDTKSTGDTEENGVVVCLGQAVVL